MAEWWSIEVFHGEFSAGRWQDTYANALPEPGGEPAFRLTGVSAPGVAEPAQAGAV